MNLAKWRACDGKKAHRTRAAAATAVRVQTARGARRLAVYACPFGRHYHVGHMPYPEDGS